MFMGGMKTEDIATNLDIQPRVVLKWVWWVRSRLDDIFSQHDTYNKKKESNTTDIYKCCAEIRKQAVAIRRLTK